MHRIIIGPIVVALLFLPIASLAPAWGQVAQNSTTVVLHYKDVETYLKNDSDEISRSAKLDTTITLTLSGANTIHEIFRSVSEDGKVFQNTADSTLGQKIRVLTWHAVSKDRLVRIIDRPTYTTTTTVTMHGNTCELRIDQRLKPGNKFVLFPRMGGGLVRALPAKQLDLSCSITQGQ